MRIERGAVVLCLLASVVMTAVSCRAETQLPAPSPELLDYLIQDVCVDGSDRPTRGDPANCTSHRNLRIGEPLPYILTDFDHLRAASDQSVSTIPVHGTDGQLKVLVIKILQGRFTPDFRFSFGARRDGFDLIDVSHSNYASIVRTYDPGCYDQLFSRNGHARNLADRSGGWVLFPLRPSPTRWPTMSSLRLTTWRLQLSAAPSRCASNHATGITVWYRPASFDFETGKTLTALRSDHFAAENLAQSENSFERFYFTREYGMTRWESWQTAAYCRKASGAAGRCGGPASPQAALCGSSASDEVHGGQLWVRVDCRDFTRFLPLTRPQLPPSSMANRDGVADVGSPTTAGPTR